MAQFSVMQRYQKLPWIILLGYGKHYSSINTELYLGSYRLLLIWVYQTIEGVVLTQRAFWWFHSNLFRFHLAFLGHHILLSRPSKSGWREENICVRDDSSNVKLNSLHPLWKVSANGNAECNYLLLILIFEIIFQEISRLMHSEEE